MNFKNHIQHIISKISKNTGILYKIRDFLPLSSRKNYYYAYIYPYLSYNIILWGDTCQNILQPLIIQHKRCIRTICNSRKFDHTAPLFKRLQFLQVKDIFHFSLGTYMHREVNKGQFSLPHSRNTRQSSRNLAAARFQNLTQTQRSASYIGPTIWNSIPSNIRNIECFTQFKKYLKNYYIDLYEDSSVSHVTI